MKKYLKFIGMILSIVVLMNVGKMTIYAEGSVEISADKTACENGDKISVTIAAVADDGQAAPPQLSVEYNANRLSFDNCSVEYGGGGGGLITINDTDAIIDFTTLSGGDATISVTAVLNDDSTNVQQAQVTISVNGEDIAAASEETVSSETGVEAGTIAATEGKVVQTVFADEFMPILFHKATTTYQGQTVECAQFDMADMTLLYITDDSGADAKFCTYNQASGELTDFRMIQGIENRFIIILNEETPEVPLGYTKAVLDWNGQTLTAYMNMDAANSGASAFGGLNPNDFFLIYGLSSEGNKGWYQYDQSEGTYQRFLQTTDASMYGNDNEGNVTEKNKGEATSFLDDILSRKVQTILLLVFAGLVLILIIVVIILAIKCAEYNDYEYVDPEEYYNRQSVASRNVKVTAAAMAQNQMQDDNDDEEQEDDGEELPEEAENSNKSMEADSVSDDEEQTDEMGVEEDYFNPRYSKREMKEREKQLRREEKEAAREEKWRQKEEKKAAKMRERGYEEAQPMDWSSFGGDNDNDDRRPTGRGNLPSYMTGEMPQNVETELSQDNVEAVNESVEQKEEAKELPPRKVNPAYAAEREAESARAMKEEEMRMKQKRLFEQQQQIEERRRIEQEQMEEKHQMEQEAYSLRQMGTNEELDEDFQFEFLEL